MEDRARDKPVIVQSDRTVLVDVAHPQYEEARATLSAFAELERSPDHVHTYRITPVAIWNAAAAGHSAEEVLGKLADLSQYPLPVALGAALRGEFARYGQFRLIADAGRLVLESDDRRLLAELARRPVIEPLIECWLSAHRLQVRVEQRGHLKQALAELGWPVEDLAGYAQGAPLTIGLRTETGCGHPFHLRDYQRGAVDAFWGGGSSSGGSGVVVLPCGAGKTVVGIGAMVAAQTQTLILCSGTAAVRQWISEILDKTTLGADEVGEYSGAGKAVRPVTVATYQILTYRAQRRQGTATSGSEFPHLHLLTQHDWGLIVYDEVHLLPAPVFRITAELQARRRLGLTATLVREDGREREVFSLIGPKRFELGWRVLEQQGWIAPATCQEIRVPLPAEWRHDYGAAEYARTQYRIAAENPAKLDVLYRLLEAHATDRVLIIGQYLDQLAAVAAATGAPLVTGKTPARERDELFEQFRRGQVPRLIVSKVANFAIDLPAANVAIQISGTFGSRQEEAQRLGRILRPKPDGGPARFYTLVTSDTNDQDYAARRQLFLTEQGYRYTIVDASGLADKDASSFGLE